MAASSIARSDIAVLSAWVSDWAASAARCTSFGKAVTSN